VLTPGAPTIWPGMNWIDYDNLAGDLWVLTAGINPDSVFTMNHTGANVKVCDLPPGGANGSPSAMDANDCAWRRVT
jgi:hypothetical protein